MYDPTIASRWWSDLQPTRFDGTPNWQADPGALAALRRGELREIMLVPATIDLFRRLEYRRPNQLVDVALCAGVLAHVRQDNRDAPAARQMSGLLHPARFNQLLATDTEPENRLAELRRAIAIVRGVIHVRDIARACLHWTDRLAQLWVLQYAGALNPQE